MAKVEDGGAGRGKGDGGGVIPPILNQAWGGVDRDVRVDVTGVRSAGPRSAVEVSLACSASSSRLRSRVVRRGGSTVRQWEWKGAGALAFVTGRLADVFIGDVAAGLPWPVAVYVPARCGRVLGAVVERLDLPSPWVEG